MIPANDNSTQLQARVNFVRMLELMYQVDFKSTRDFKSTYAHWVGEGRPVDLGLIRVKGIPEEKTKKIIRLKPLEFQPRYDR